jgi:hypothetical protein
MSTPRNLDLERFAAFLESRPGKLGCWRDGALGSYPTLAWLNVHPVVKQRSLMAEVGPLVAVALTNSAHHNQVGISAGWVCKYMTGVARGSTSEQDRRALWTAAGRYWTLRNLLVEVRVGVREFRSDGTRITLAYSGDREVDALDRMLDLMNDGDQFRKRRRGREPRLVEWLKAEGKTCPWHQTPDWARELYRALARDVISGYPSYLPSTVTVAGIRVVDRPRLLLVRAHGPGHAHERRNPLGVRASADNVRLPSQPFWVSSEVHSDARSILRYEL